MHSVYDAFDDAEGDEAPDIDAVEQGEIFEDPRLQVQALAEGGIERD
jgi:hypothetical protein